MDRGRHVGWRRLAAAAAFGDTGRCGPVDPASEAEADAEFEAQASAAEQDATVEAVMDPALEFDVDECRRPLRRRARQSLEDAVAAYEARLAAEDLERQSMAAAEPVTGAVVTEAVLEPEIEAEVRRA